MTARSTPPPVATRPWIAIGAIAAVLAALAFVFGNSEALRPETAPPPLDPITEIAEIDPLASPVGWTQLPRGPLASRMGHAAVWTGNELIIWAGRALDTDYRGGASFKDGQWSFLPTAPMDGGGAHATAWTGRDLFAFTNAAAIYDPVTNRWQPIPDSDRAAAAPVAAVATETEVILVSRELRSGTLDAVAYGLEGDCCRTLPAPPIDLTHGTVAWTGDAVVLIGGSSDALALASYDPRIDAWHVHDAPPLAASGRIAASWNGEALIAVDFELQSAAWDPIDGWQTLPAVPVEPAGCIARTAAVGEHVFAWYCRQAALLDPATDEWRLIEAPTLDDHAVSTSCSPVGAGDRILMWCGNGDGGDPFLWELDPGTTVARVGR